MALITRASFITAQISRAPEAMRSSVTSRRCFACRSAGMRVCRKIRTTPRKPKMSRTLPLRSSAVCSVRRNLTLRTISAMPSVIRRVVSTTVSIAFCGQAGSVTTGNTSILKTRSLYRRERVFLYGLDVRTDLRGVFVAVGQCQHSGDCLEGAGVGSDLLTHSAHTFDTQCKLTLFTRADFGILCGVQFIDEHGDFAGEDRHALAEHCRLFRCCDFPLCGKHRGYVGVDNRRGIVINGVRECRVRGIDRCGIGASCESRCDCFADAIDLVGRKFMVVYEHRLKDRDSFFTQFGREFFHILQERIELFAFRVMQENQMECPSRVEEVGERLLNHGADARFGCIAHLLVEIRPYEVSCDCLLVLFPLKR